MEFYYFHEAAGGRACILDKRKDRAFGAMIYVSKYRNNLGEQEKLRILMHFSIKTDESRHKFQRGPSGMQRIAR